MAQTNIADLKMFYEKQIDKKIGQNFGSRKIWIGKKNYTIACAFKHYLFLSYYQISEYFLDFYENIHSENSDLKNFGA